MDLRSQAVNETAFFHVLDAADNPLFDNGEPVTITMYGPGSKPYAKATAARNSRMMDKLRKKGRAELSAEQAAAENAQFLADVTVSMEHIERDGLQGEALFKAIYSDIEIGFIAEQAMKFCAEWSNFLKPAPKA